LSDLSLVTIEPTMPLGLRAKNKAEKLERIRKAARALFVKHGYDDTTMRDIAKRAGIGFGTIFTYASDKRDLLFLIFNDDLDNVVAHAVEDRSAKKDFVDQLVTYFAGFYRFYAPQPQLSRVVLREMTFFIAGRQAEQFQASCGRMTQHLTDFVVAARAAGQIATREDATIVAQALLSTFASEVRRWIAGNDPNLKRGLARLRRMLALQIAGLAPHATKSANPKGRKT
jgi:AcrR family transcriptional regulator